MSTTLDTYEHSENVDLRIADKDLPAVVAVERHNRFYAGEKPVVVVRAEEALRVMRATSAEKQKTQLFKSSVHIGERVAPAVVETDDAVQAVRKLTQQYLLTKNDPIVVNAQRDLSPRTVYDQNIADLDPEGKPETPTIDVNKIKESIDAIFEEVGIDASIFDPQNDELSETV